MSWDSNRLGLSWEFYLDSDSLSGETAILEFQVGDDIDNFELWIWKNSAWTQVGHWGDEDSWGDTEVITDQNSVSHNFKANIGDRGDAVSGIGTISKLLGFEQRVLMSVTLNAHSGTDLYTDYGTDQLLIKVKAIHTQRDAKRPYPVSTYIDGSLDYGRA